MTFDPFSRPGLRPTVVQRAAVVRTEWTERSRQRARLRPGQIEPNPIGTTQGATLHRGITDDGTEAFVFRSTPNVIERRHSCLREVAGLTATAISTAPVLRRTSAELWLDRRPYAQRIERGSAATIEMYVTSLVQEALRAGTIVATGVPYLQRDGEVGTIEALVTHRLEVDQREVLAEIWNALVMLDPLRLTDATSELCKIRPSGLVEAVERSVLGLMAEWTDVSLGLSLHHLACAAATAGSRAEPLVVLADELLHRLDLAHHQRVTIRPFATQTTARLLPIREMAAP